MQFMLMCCIDESRWLALPDAERDAVMRDYGAWVADVEREGKHRATEKLAGSGAAKTLRVQGGRRAVTDGPYAETKEVLFSFYILDVEDLDAAIAWAAKTPAVEYGSVAIYPTDGLELK
jgi:hypothetical protein